MTALSSEHRKGVPTLPFYQVALVTSGVRGLDHVARMAKGRRAIVGSSTAVLGDLTYTPLGLLPGVKVQAAVTELLMRGHMLKPRWWVADLAFVLGTFLVVTLTGHPLWKLRKTLPWLVFPGVAAFVLIAATVTVARGQAMGIRRNADAAQGGVLAPVAPVCLQSRALTISTCITGQTFEFQLGSDPKFAKPMVQQTLQSPEINMLRPFEGEYFMRFRAIDPDGFVGPYIPPQRIVVPHMPHELVFLPRP